MGREIKKLFLGRGCLTRAAFSRAPHTQHARAQAYLIGKCNDRLLDEGRVGNLGCITLLCSSLWSHGVCGSLDCVTPKVFLGGKVLGYLLGGSFVGVPRIFVCERVPANTPKPTRSPLLCTLPLTKCRLVACVLPHVRCSADAFFSGLTHMERHTLILSKGKQVARKPRTARFTSGATRLPGALLDQTQRAQPRELDSATCSPTTLR